jgi:hypothetical protein
VSHLPTDAGGSFEVHLGELRHFARRLREHAGVLDAHRADLADVGLVTGRRALFGDFAEAESLAGLHAGVVRQLDTLYRRVHGLVGWASGLAGEISDEYERGDREARDGYRALSRDLGETR